jgi:hypothetical protein
MLEVILTVIAMIIPSVAIWMEGAARKRDQAREQAALELETKRYEDDNKLQATHRLAEWAKRATELLSLADHVQNSPLSIRGKTHSDKSRLELAAQISGLVDEGRWLFQNHHPEAFGKNKARINHGFRDNRLDPLVKAYQKLLGNDSIDPSTLRKDFAWKVQQLSIPLSEQIIREDK